MHGRREPTKPEPVRSSLRRMLSLLCLSMLLSLSLAGCLGPGTPPPEAAGPAPEVATTGPCLAVEVTAEPVSIRAEEEMAVTAHITNRCGAPIEIQGSDSCSREAAVAAVDGRHLAQGSAGAQGCYQYLPPARTVPAGETIEASWMWNGTYLVYGDRRVDSVPVDPGTYVIEAWLHGDADVRGTVEVEVEAPGP